MSQQKDVNRDMKADTFTIVLKCHLLVKKYKLSMMTEGML